MRRFQYIGDEVKHEKAIKNSINFENMDNFLSRQNLLRDKTLRDVGSTTSQSSVGALTFDQIY